MRMPGCRYPGAYLLIAATTAAIFLGVLAYPWMEIEDTPYYRDNPLFSPAPLLSRLIACWLHAPESNYIPLTWSFTILLDEVFGSSATAFRTVALLAHLANIALALHFCKRLKLPILPATLAILIFAIHPLRVESIAWASSLKGLFATFFCLLALNLQASPRLNYRGALIIGLFVTSLLCKQTLMLLPMILFLLGRSREELALSLRNYSILGGLAALGLAIAFAANIGNPNLEIHRYLHPGFTPERALSAMGHYTLKQFLPLPLFPEYPLRTSWLLALLGGLALAPLGLLGWCFFKRKPIALPLALYAGFPILLLPVLGFFSSPLEFAADRLSYLPSLFFWLSLTTAWVSRPALSTPVLLLAAVVFGTLTARQLGNWRDAPALANTMISAEPGHYMANYYLSNHFAKNGEWEQALTTAQKTARTHPHRYGIWLTLTQVHLATGHPQRALDELAKAENLSPLQRPYLALLTTQPLRKLARYQDALAACDHALELGADTFTVLVTRAQILLDRGDVKEARTIINTLTLERPNSPEVRELRERSKESER